MRSLVFLLVAVNTVILAWGLLRPDSETPVETPARPVPLGVERLVLLSEIGGDVETLAPAPVRAVAAVCVRAGPLQEQADAVAVVTRARSLGLGARLSAVDVVSGPPDLQVHLPPLPSAEQASRAVRELAALGIEAYVIPDGDHAGAVSVGMFTEREPANERRGEVAALGYPVRIVELPRTRRLWDVRLEGPGVEALDAFLLGLRGDWPDLSGDRVPCEDRGGAPAASGPGAPARPPSDGAVSTRLRGDEPIS